MSRTNPYKKKRRRAKRTALLYCEGLDEKVFLEYLKQCFARNTGVAVNVKENHGGSANDVLSNVRKQILGDKTLCIYDTDTSVDISLKRKVERVGIECMENSPCFEAFLLSILTGKDYSHLSKCDGLKREFEQNYLDSKKRKDKKNYEKIFPKKLLEKRAKDIPNLGRLIDIMQNNF